MDEIAYCEQPSWTVPSGDSNAGDAPALAVEANTPTVENNSSHLKSLPASDSLANSNSATTIATFNTNLGPENNDQAVEAMSPTSNSGDSEENKNRRPRAPRSPGDLIMHHLGAQITSDNQARALQNEEKQILPSPTLRQKQWYCSCFTNCHDADSKVKCPCKKNKEPCDQEKCHKRPKGVWLAWGNGDQCDCRRLGTKEEERKYQLPKDRMKVWAKGGAFLP